jgi:integrase
MTNDQADGEMCSNAYCDSGNSPPQRQRTHSGIICPPPIPARKRGKRMSRRKGQNPEVRVGKRANGEKYFYFQYWLDVAGDENRRRLTEVIGTTKQMTRSEAERKKLEFISNLKLNSNGYQIPSSATFTHALKHYREVFAPRMLRASTISVANGRIKAHLEADWKDVPIEHITIDSVNEWAWRKRQSGISWTTIKDALRTMQRILSAFSKDRKPPFSQAGLAIPERDKLQMRIHSRQSVSFSWAQAEAIAGQVRRLDTLGDARRKQYETLVLLAAASGLRSSELLALKVNDVDFKAGTIRVDESSDQRTGGKIGPCKNAAAYRTVALRDAEGLKAMRALKRFLRSSHPHELVFRSRMGGPLLETTILGQGLHLALKAVGQPKGGLHGFRRGCNRRWELAGINPAVIRQQMGHTSARMTSLYSGEIPLDQVVAAFSKTSKAAQLEKMENEVAA